MLETSCRERAGREPPLELGLHSRIRASERLREWASRHRIFLASERYDAARRTTPRPITVGIRDNEWNWLERLAECSSRIEGVLGERCLRTNVGFRVPRCGTKAGGRDEIAKIFGRERGPHSSVHINLGTAVSLIPRESSTFPIHQRPGPLKEEKQHSACRCYASMRKTTYGTGPLPRDVAYGNRQIDVVSCL